MAYQNGSDDEAGWIDADVSFAEGADGAFAAMGDRPEVDKQDLVFAVVDEFVEVGFHLGDFTVIEVALEDRILQVNAVAFAELEDLAQALGIADIVGDDIIAAHV